MSIMIQISQKSTLLLYYVPKLCCKCIIHTKIQTVHLFFSFPMLKYTIFYTISLKACVFPDTVIG